MEHTITMFIADRTMNELMKHFDLRPNYKWFIVPQTLSFTTTAPLSDEHFALMIEKSRSDYTGGADKWIPAIRYMDNFYCDKSVKELSDGKHVIFTQT